MSFIDRVQVALDSRGMNQAELCRMTGLRSSNFTKWKAGSSPSVDTAAQIALALDVSLDWLAGISDEIAPGFKSEEERELMSLYRSTDERGKDAIMTIAESQAGDARVVQSDRRRSA